MSEQEILKGNKLIAEFIGAVYIRREDLFDDHIIEEFIYNNNHPISKQIPKVTENLYHLRYHLSWDWLMPVVEKIEETSFEKIKSDYVPYTKHPLTVSLNYKYAKITVDNDYKLQNIHKEGIIFNEYNEESKIIACYKAVVEFIKWYNQNKLNETN